MIIKTVIDIRQPVAIVFKYFVEPSNLPKWMESFQRLESVKGKRPRKGSISKQIFNDSNGRLEITEEILVFERNKKFNVRLSHKNMDTNQNFEFLNQGETTRLILTTQIRLRPAFMGLFSIFMKGRIQKQQEENLKRFKKLLEK